MFFTKINPEIIDYLRVRIGPVAQLNRASDSGSAGLGFESQRGHEQNPKVRSTFKKTKSRDRESLLSRARDSVFLFRTAVVPS